MIARALSYVDVEYVWWSLRKQKIDLAGRKSWCKRNDTDFAAKAADVVGFYMAPPCFLTWSTGVNDAPFSDWPCRIENQHST